MSGYRSPRSRVRHPRWWVGDIVDGEWPQQRPTHPYCRVAVSPPSRSRCGRHASPQRLQPTTFACAQPVLTSPESIALRTSCDLRQSRRCGRNEQGTSVMSSPAPPRGLLRICAPQGGKRPRRTLARPHSTAGLPERQRPLMRVFDMVPSRAKHHCGTTDDAGEEAKSCVRYADHRDRGRQPLQWSAQTQHRANSVVSRTVSHVESPYAGSWLEVSLLRK